MTCFILKKVYNYYDSKVNFKGIIFLNYKLIRKKKLYYSIKKMLNIQSINNLLEKYQLVYIDKFFSYLKNLNDNFM